MKIRAILIAGCVAGLMSASATIAAPQTQLPAVQALANHLRATISAQPAGSKFPAYQAQLSATIENDNVSCEIVQQALRQNYSGSSEEALKALARLRNAFARCAGGPTGAIGGGNGGRNFSGVGFSVGGGSSNYVK
jgi:hypothetical protein